MDASKVGTSGCYSSYAESLIPNYGWKVRFDYQPEVRCKPFTLPRLTQVKDFLGMSLRYTFKFYLKKRLVEHRLPFIDPSKHVSWKPIYGVPIGGIGCGAIGRGYRGEFLRSSLIPGMYCYDIQPADQFIVTLRRNGETVYQNVLSPHKTTPVRGTSLDYWTWGFPSDQSYYTGLYPRSWTVYKLPEFKLVLICKQISPVLPHDYQESCLPACVFVWQVLNFSAEPIHVTITFSWHGPNPPARQKSKGKTAGVSNGQRKQSSQLSPSNSVKPSSEPIAYEFGGGASNRVSSTQSLGDDGTVYACRSASFRSTETKRIAGCLLERRLGGEMDCCFGVAAKEDTAIRVGCCPGFLFNKASSEASRRRKPDRAPSDQPTANEQPSFYGRFSGSPLSPEVIAFETFDRAPFAGAFWKQLASGLGLPSLSEASGYEISEKAMRRKQNSPRLAVAVSAGCDTPPIQNGAGENGDCGVVPGCRQLEFALVWHAPLVKFRAGDVTYTRRYARWFPELGMTGTRRLLEHALSEWSDWNSSIDKWQNPILQDSTLSAVYKSALFNELYYLTDGGTLWLDPVSVEDVRLGDSLLAPIDLVRAYKSDSDLDPNRLTGRHLDGQAMPSSPAEQTAWLAWRRRCQLAKKIGLFAYLEGHEYRMFNTIDVHHYASWALIKLWPRLQLAIMYDCADLTVAEDRARAYYMHRGRLHPRSRESAVPHDFGDPEDEPWRRINAYTMFHTDEWKDLSPKFVLQVWRDWKHTQDYHYLLYMLQITCRIVRKCLLAWDLDQDGVIENSGYPDQTYDAWKTKGISAYTGGIWLACVYAAHDMLQSALSANSPIRLHVQDSVDELGTPWKQVESQLAALLANAKLAYETSLWTGSYYAYQKRSAGSNHRSIMAAQLSGHWFLRVGGAPEYAILPQNHVVETLKTIRDVNWRSIENGTLGAINGALSPFRKDISNVQAEEFWVGVNYALAATMVMEGMETEGLSLAEACYNTVYKRFGLQYQTPEAYMMDGRFRCPGYMRPLSIWSVQQAIELKRSSTESVVP